MPLHILLILVIGGIAGIALALHLLGLTKAPPLTQASARSAWLRAFPDDRVDRTDVTSDGRAARVETDNGRGVVWQMGADTCARRLHGIEEAHVRRGRVTLYLKDYAAPRVTVTLTQDEQAEWADWMARI
ncbi:hypothetical protein [uncultured Tateyamaria sp.]|uniref:hypothetical protein n=1 Tax=Tateyamaria sp. 1078 TaxID=3417464 RepID=UPI0026285813|nr:hypothetical protein [uncultured Tateyamaria sp.]